MKKNVLIIGGTKGIGKELSIHFLKEEAIVTSVYANDEENATRFRAECAELHLMPVTFRANISSAQQRLKLFEFIEQNHKRIDHLILCAAAGKFDSVFKINEKELLWTIQNSTTMYHALILALKDRLVDGGRIVFYTSTGSKRVVKNYFAIGVAKAALECMIKYYAVELAEKKITVNGINAGPIQSLALSKIYNNKSFETANKFSQNPFDKLLIAKDLVGTTSFLCGDGGCHITGEIINVNSGRDLLTQCYFD